MSQKSSDCCSKPEWYEVEKTKKLNSFCILLKNVISLHVTAPPALIDYQTNCLPSTFNSVAEFWVLLPWHDSILSILLLVSKRILQRYWLNFRGCKIGNLHTMKRGAQGSTEISNTSGLVFVFYQSNPF